MQHIFPDGKNFCGLYLVPLGSSFGSTATFASLAWLGGSIAILPKFDASDALSAIHELRPTHIFAVPTMLQRMAADPHLQDIDTSCLKGLICGGAVIDEVTVRRCVDAFGCGFISLYGSADGVNCHNMPNEPLDVVFHSVGHPDPSVCAIKIIDEQGEEVAKGQIGEIKARGPLSPMQYVNAPELDNQYRDIEGWVRTGDLGYIDVEGNLVLAGRKKDIIIRGGANISPVQIESLVIGYPDIVNVACVPVPDEDLGQRVCVCVTLREGAQRFALTALTHYLREQGLEVNKLPEYLRFYRNLPITPAGKVDKKQLAAEAATLSKAT